MSDIIEGAIIDITNSSEVVMNRGKEHGVENGMKFVIFSLGEKIEDPETGEMLGPIEHVKANVKAKHTQSRVTTLKSTESGTTSIAKIAYGMGESTKSIANQPENSVDTTVQEGDKVRQVR